MDADEGVTEGDKSVLAGLAREVREESGLSVSSVRRVVGLGREEREGEAEAEEEEGESGDKVEGEGKGEGERLGYIFTSRSGKVILKIHFLVDVDLRDSEKEDEGEGLPTVRLDPNEHVEYLWAEEGEVRSGIVRGMGREERLLFTTEEQRRVVLEGFRVWREARAEGEDRIEKW